MPTVIETSVNCTMDLKNGIHRLETWPVDRRLPDVGTRGAELIPSRTAAVALSAP